MLKNKKGLVFGIANNHSIAWGIAKQLAENGAEIAIGYQNEILLKRVKPLSEAINSMCSFVVAISGPMKLRCIGFPTSIKLINSSNTHPEFNNAPSFSFAAPIICIS